jgi:hypothetical protein
VSSSHVHAGDGSKSAPSCLNAMIALIMPLAVCDTPRARDRGSMHCEDRSTCPVQTVDMPRYTLLRSYCAAFICVNT